jgi:hypothetical protein
MFKRRKRQAAGNGRRWAKLSSAVAAVGAGLGGLLFWRKRKAS